MTLWIYGSILNTGERYEAACNPLVEAVKLTRKLRKVHADRFRFLLVVCLQQYAFSLHARKMYAAACYVRFEAVDITRKLRTHDGHKLAHLEKYATWLRTREMYAPAWMPRLMPSVLHASFAHFVRENTKLIPQVALEDMSCSIV